MSFNSISLRVVASTVALAAPGLAVAQADTDEEVIEEIVVTGTGASVARTEFETPQSVTQFNEEDIRSFSSSSQASIYP